MGLGPGVQHMAGDLEDQLVRHGGEAKGCQALKDILLQHVGCPGRERELGPQEVEYAAAVIG